MKDGEILFQYVGDVWSEIDHRFRIESNDIENDLLVWMNVLGILQSKADMFDISRERCGLPLDDADNLFIQYNARKT
jgi:hypothetical protein